MELNSLTRARRTAQVAEHRGTALREVRHLAILVAMGLLALALGTLVYLTDRDGVHAVLIPVLPALAGSHWFGAVGLWLPSLVHPFAFSLFTAVALPAQSAWRYGACAAWFALDAAFECGQHPAIGPRLAAAIERCLGSTALGRTLANYFAGGGFDGADITAAGLGALAAAAVLHAVRGPWENHHAL